MSEQVWRFFTVGFVIMSALGFISGTLYYYDINRSVTLFITSRPIIQMLLMLIYGVFYFMTMLNMFRLQSEDRQVNSGMILQVIGWSAFIWILLSWKNGWYFFK